MLPAPPPDEAPAAVPDATPQALAEPARRVGRGWICAIALANLGMWMAFFGPLQVLLPEQIGAIPPASKEIALGWTTGAGAAVAMIATPLAGGVSDRRGRRRGMVTLSGHVDHRTQRRTPKASFSWYRDFIADRRAPGTAS